MSETDDNRPEILFPAHGCAVADDAGTSQRNSDGKVTADLKYGTGDVAMLRWKMCVMAAVMILAVAGCRGNKAVSAPPPAMPNCGCGPAPYAGAPDPYGYGAPTTAPPVVTPGFGG